MRQKMGERQRWVWMLTGLSVVAATETCTYHWTWGLLGGLAIAGYDLFLERFVPSSGLAAAMSSMGWIGKAAILLTLFWNTIAMGWVASLADQAFPMADGFPILGWILLLVAAWGSWKGAEVCARCCGVLSLFLLVLYGIIVVFALPDLQWDNLKSVGDWRDGIWIAGLLLMGTGVWYMPCNREKNKADKTMAIVLPVGTVILSVITAGVLSPALVRASDVPLFVVAKSVSLFGVIERIESLLSAAMTMGVFALLSTMATASQCLGNELKPWRYYGLCCCGLAFGTMYLGKYIQVEFQTFCAIIVWLILPITTIVGNRFFRPNQ